MPGRRSIGRATRFLNFWFSGPSFPILFFSFSQSKLPGYILPSIPPITILTGDYLFRQRPGGLHRLELAGHAVLCGMMTMFALAAALVCGARRADAAGAGRWASPWLRRRARLC